MDEYKDIKDLLKPQRQIGASAHLRQRVSKALAQKRNTSTRWMWSGVAAACAAMIVEVLTKPRRLPKPMSPGCSNSCKLWLGKMPPSKKKSINSCNINS